SFLSLSGAPIPQAMIGFFARETHAKIATGVVNVTVEGVTLGATGIDQSEFDAMSGGFNYLSGGPLKGPRDAIVDDYIANQKKYQVGSTFRMSGLDWRVSGIMESGKLSHIVVPIATLQDQLGYQGKVSQIYLKLDDPSRTQQTVEALKKDPRLEGWQIYSLAEYTSLLTVDNIPALRGFIIVIIGIGVVIGFSVVCLSMYMAVLQRTREIGILKSLGGSKGFILGIILSEALLLGLGGTILGILMSYGAWWLIHTLVPASLPMIIVYSWWPKACAITLAGTGLGSLYPGLTAAAHDPIEALAYE
ncbi:MAG: ABC transporter permease, partial [Acidobacteria bacterium]|nr:ABC transporter permease [Acidobacteriota bacterium]